jgi:hypothetical protein
MEDLIENAYSLFDDRLELPLPPAPSGEEPAKASYGSAHTKISSMPPPLVTPRREIPQPIYPTPDDFSPQLPPRPAQSIHPSARGQVPPSPSSRIGELPVTQSNPVLSPLLPPRPTAGPGSASSDSPSLPPRPTPLADTPPPPSPMSKGKSNTSLNDSRTDVGLPPSPTISVGSSAGRTTASNTEPMQEGDEVNEPTMQLALSPLARNDGLPRSSASTAESFESAQSYDDVTPQTAVTLGHSPASPTIPFPSMATLDQSPELDQQETSSDRRADAAAAPRA